MQNCIQKFTRAPIEYINQLRALKTGAITMKQTTFYPAFPLALLSSILCVCGLATYMIYYFFTTTENVCFWRILYGVIALAIIYPIQSILIYICLLGSVSLAQSMCWKVFTMIFFGFLVTGFSFGGLGFAFLCTIASAHPLLIPATFFTNNAFIQGIVYSYISFFLLYLILVPILTISHNQRSKDPNPQSSCFDTFCCVIYYFCQILFLITALFMILIKILGPPLLIYVLIEVARAGMQNSVGSLTVFFVLSILSICLPMLIFTIVYIITNYICKPKQGQQNKQQTQKPLQNETQLQSTVKHRKSVFLPTQDSKTFGEASVQNETIQNDGIQNNDGTQNNGIRESWL